MKTLILMRHAKSSWADPGADDHDRKLNKRGRSSAPVMAEWLDKQGLQPDRVLCSSARRTRETLELMRDATPSLPAPEVLEGLYHSGPGSLKQHLAGLPGSCDCVLLIGHEPGLSAFVRILGGGAAAADCRRAYDHFPTAAVAVLEADIGSWGELGADRTEFVAFVTPRELME